MADVKMKRGLQASYDALQTKDTDTLYFCLDTGRHYLGDLLLDGDTDWDSITDKPSLDLNGGLKIYYNGLDVTNVAAMQQTVQNAHVQWFGSQDAYNDLVDNNRVDAGVAYHILVQPDWEEVDTSHLGYIKNQPKLLDMSYVDNHVLKFFYTRHGQEITT